VRLVQRAPLVLALWWLVLWWLVWLWLQPMMTTLQLLLPLRLAKCVDVSRNGPSGPFFLLLWLFYSSLV
jgi:hypothetical protein